VLSANISKEIVDIILVTDYVRIRKLGVKTNLKL
jgi:hypothetical protein